MDELVPSLRRIAPRLLMLCTPLEGVAKCFTPPPPPSPPCSPHQKAAAPGLVRCIRRLVLHLTSSLVFCHLLFDRQRLASRCRRGEVSTSRYLQDRHSSALPRGKLERGVIPLICHVVQLFGDQELLVGPFAYLQNNGGIRDQQGRSGRGWGWNPTDVDGR